MKPDAAFSPAGESKRIKRLRAALVNVIPKFPNNRETREILQAKPLNSLLLAYVTWASRLIHPKPRLVTLEPTLTSDPLWRALSEDTKALLAKASRGDDLNAHLSLKVLRNGFTPATSSTKPGTNKWEDKDFFLTVMGYHHFHLSQDVEAGGHVKRTDHVLFAQVTTERFIAIGFFNHSVFSAVTSGSQMNSERNRLWSIYERRITIGMEPNAVYISNPIATSGHSLHHINLVRKYSWVLHHIDPRLDTLADRFEIFSDLQDHEVKKMKLSWRFNFLDLGLLDDAASKFHVLQYGAS